MNKFNMNNKATPELENTNESADAYIAKMDECVDELVWEERFKRGSTDLYVDEQTNKPSLPQGWIALRIRVKTQPEFTTATSVVRKLRRFIDIKAVTTNSQGIFFWTPSKNEEMVRYELARRNVLVDGCQAIGRK